MPRGKANKGRRGGRRTAKTELVKEDTVVEIDLDSSDLNLDSSNMDLDSSDMNLNSSDMNADDSELVEGVHSEEKNMPLELADDEVLSSKTETTAQTLGCSDGMTDAIDTEENPVNEVDQDKESGIEGTEVKKCIETSEEMSHIEEKLNSKSIYQDNDSIHEDETIMDINKAESLITEQAESTQLGTVHESNKIEEESTELVDDEKKDNDLQNTDKKTNEDYNLLDVAESASNNKINLQQITEETGNSVASDIAHKTVATVDLLESEDIEELENNKFEEISEGSIDQAEQDDLIAESLSDVEITGESFDPKKVQNSKNVPNVKGNIKVLYKKSQPLEPIYFSRKDNDKVKSAAENKDNDDISDASLSDHVDADLSLEEISDDELEPSKKRRKSLGHTPVKTGSDVKGREDIKPDKENPGRADDLFEKAKTDEASVKAQKHASSEDIDANKPSSNKRMKLDEKDDIEEVSSKGEEMSSFSKDKYDNSKNKAEQSDTKGLDVSYNQNVAISNRNRSQSSTNWRRLYTERSFESRDLAALKRKYDMVDSSCQSEPRLLKGKIVQCNINPIKLSSELDKDKSEKYADGAFLIFELLRKLKHKLPSKIPDTVISDVSSLQSSQKKGVYSTSLGPLILSDTLSSTFKDILVNTEDFSLVFDNHCHGVFKATFAKRDDIVSLFTWMNHQELNRHDMVMSLLYSCEEEGHVSVWKATLLRVNDTGVQTENPIMADDVGNVRLYLHGTPTGVSTSFIHLLFPEAQNVVTDPGTRNGIVILDYSSPKMVESVLSSYGLLVINGSQISISHVRLPDYQQNVNMSTETINESDTFVKKGTEYEEQSDRCGRVSENVEHGAEYGSQQMELKAQFDISNKHEIKGSEQEPSQVMQTEVTIDLGKEVSSLTLGDAQDLEKVLMNSKSHMSVISGTDSSLTLTDNAKETNAEEKDTVLQTNDEFAEKTEVRNKAIENNVIDKIAVQENEPRNQVGETGEEVTSDSAPCLAEVGTVIAEDADKREAREQNETRSENKPLINRDTTTLECDNEMPLQVVDFVIPEKEIPKIAVEGGNINKTADEAEAGKENLEDVSDDEMLNHNKHENINAGIAVEVSSKQETSNIDLTIDCAKDLDNDNAKVRTEDEDKKSFSQVGESDGAKAGHTESRNSTLVMTDGSLEVLMEVIDVNDDDAEVEKIINPRTWSRSQDRPTDADFYHSPYANKSGMHPNHKDPYNEPPTRVNMSSGSRQQYSWRLKESPDHKEMLEKSAAQQRDSFPPKRRSRSSSPRRDVNSYTRHSHDYRSYESQQTGRYRDSRRIESYSKHHGTVKPSAYSSHRDPYYSERRHDYKAELPRPHSLSRRSESPENKVALRKSPDRRESPKHTILHTSRSPISISSRSNSLSPISKSPSVDLPQTGEEKDELVKTVEHFLKLAKGLHHTQKRRPVRPRSSRRSSSRYSPHDSRSPYIKRSRSPQPTLSRSSRSPTYTRSSRYKYRRSPSPASYGNDHKRHYGNYSFSARKGDSFSKGSGSSRNYEREKPQRFGDDEQSGRSKSGKWPTEQYKSQNDQPWQQPHGGYQSQSYGTVPASNIYSPSFPPPGCPPQQAQPGVYPGSSMPVYQYNQSQYSYSNMPPSVPPPYMPSVPPPPPHSFTQPYQSAYPVYPPRF